MEESNRSDKRLKNKSSRRIIPIHDLLINLGFLDYVEIVRNKLKKERLFHQLTYVDGNYNKNVSRFWNQYYLPDLGLKTPKKNFHSLRHTCSNHLKQKGIHSDYLQELLGHTTGKITLERYGESYNPSILSVLGGDILLFPNKSRIHKMIVVQNLLFYDIPTVDRIRMDDLDLF